MDADKNKTTTKMDGDEYYKEFHIGSGYQILSIVKSAIRRHHVYNAETSSPFHQRYLQTESMAEKEGGIVKQGHEEGLKLALSLLQQFKLPEGLLPLSDVIEVGFVKSTGYMWIVQKNKVQHEFKMISKMVSYSSEITGYICEKKIQKLKGVKAKELMLWPPVSEIALDDPPTGKIHFKSLAGITKTFPVEAFAGGQ